MQKATSILTLGFLVALFASVAFAPVVKAAPAKCFSRIDGVTKKVSCGAAAVNDDQCYLRGATGGFVRVGPGSCEQLEAAVANGGRAPGGTTSNPGADEAAKLNSANACSQAASSGGLTAAETTNCVKANPIIKHLRTAINFLALGVGIVATISIIFAGMQYTTARDNPQQIAQAKTRIIKTVAAVIIFIFMYAFLRWILPGGYA